jgi:lactoylglutathione lyase
MTESVQAAGLFETQLTVSDLDRSVTFYRDIVGLSLGLEVPERGAACFGSAGRARRCSGGGHSRRHRWLSLQLAFKASPRGCLRRVRPSPRAWRHTALALREGDR